MKEDTKLLLTKLLDINKKKNKHNAKLKPVVLTKEGTVMIKNIFNKVHVFNRKWETHQKSIIRQLKSVDALPKSNDFTYIPEEIRNEIGATCKHFYTCSFTFTNDRKFTIFLCLKHKDDKHINSIVRRIYLWLSMASEHVKPSCSKTVNIYFYLINKKKEVPSHMNEQIDKIHVNTAFTTGCQPHTNVHIFREEEWFRALIHESFHNLGFDFLQLDQNLQDDADARIRSIFPVKMREIRFNETYCEMWAEILNVIFFVYLSEPSVHIDSMVTLCKKMLFYEGMFSSWQCVKILNHNKLSYAQLYSEAHASKYKEKTQGFSYYVLKSIYMVHVSRFIHFCATHGFDNKSQFQLQFNLTSETIQDYTKIIEDNHDSIKYLNGIQIMEKELANATGVWKNTLRMSLFEGTA